MITAFFASMDAMIILTGVLVGLSGSLIGLFLVLRGASMLTDAASHSIVLGIVIVWMLTGQTSGPLQLLGAAAAGVVSVMASGMLARSGLLRDDAAIGLVFPAFFAGGVLLINLNAGNLHLDTDTVLLGEIGLVWLDTVTISGIEVPVAVATLGTVLAINAAFVTLFWKELKLASFDPGLAAGFHRGLNHDAGKARVWGQLQRDLGDGQGVTKRDQIGGFLGPHDARKPRDAQNIALFGAARGDEG